MSEPTYQDFAILEVENERTRARIAELEGHLVPPERRFTHWRGNCGHEWLKSQSEHCPYCELERADKRIEELLNGADSL